MTAFLVAMFVMSVFTATWSVHAIVHAPADIWLGAEGLLIERHSGKILLPWDTVMQVSSSITYHQNGAIQDCTLATSNRLDQLLRAPVSRSEHEQICTCGHHLTFPDMVAMICDITFPIRFANAQKQYHIGEEVDFSQLRLSRVGIHVHQKTLLWEDVVATFQSIDGGFLAFFRRGLERPWHVIHSADLPNRDVLIALITTATDAQILSVQY